MLRRYHPPGNSTNRAGSRSGGKRLSIRRLPPGRQGLISQILCPEFRAFCRGFSRYRRPCRATPQIKFWSGRSRFAKFPSMDPPNFWNRQAKSRSTRKSQPPAPHAPPSRRRIRARRCRHAHRQRNSRMKPLRRKKPKHPQRRPTQYRQPESRREFHIAVYSPTIARYRSVVHYGEQS
jgi:hypothetical protein